MTFISIRFCSHVIQYSVQTVTYISLGIFFIRIIILLAVLVLVAVVGTFSVFIIPVSSCMFSFHQDNRWLMLHFDLSICVFPHFVNRWYKTFPTRAKTKTRKGNIHFFIHYNGIIWASWRLKSPANQVLVQQLVLINNTETIKAQNH